LLKGCLADNPSNFSLEFGNVFPHDISNKLILEISPAVSDMNLISGSTQGSNEDEERLQKNMSEGELTRMQTRTGLAFTSETLDHTYIGASFTFNMDLCISQRATTNECPNLHSLESSTKEGDSHISYKLNLTLASCTFEFNQNLYSARSPQKDCQEIGNLVESRVNANGKEFEI
jgi:heat shock transcription factor, other eukaryote